MLDAIGDQTESMWGRGDDMKTELAYAHVRLQLRLQVITLSILGSLIKSDRFLEMRAVPSNV